MTYLKAIYGAVFAFLGALGTALVDSHVSAAEWVYCTVAGLTALGVIWGVPNGVKKQPEVGQ